jgi:hypothetical protein
MKKKSQKKKRSPKKFKLYDRTWSQEEYKLLQILRTLQPQSSSCFSKDQLTLILLEYINKDLMNGIYQKDPLYRCAIVGGYGLNKLLINKYNMNNIVTNDVDIRIYNQRPENYNTYKKIIDYWKQKFNSFIIEYNLKNIITCIDVGTINNGKYLLMLKYNKQDFFDVCIYNKKLDIKLIDKEVSKLANLPILIDDAYLQEYLRLIYTENVSTAEPFTYQTRNVFESIDGREKGQKTFDRSTLLCNLNNNKHIIKELQDDCDSLNKDLINIGIKTKEERDTIFKKFEKYQTKENNEINQNYILKY